MAVNLLNIGDIYIGDIKFKKIITGMEIRLNIATIYWDIYILKYRNHINSAIAKVFSTKDFKINSKNLIIL